MPRTSVGALAILLLMTLAIPAGAQRRRATPDILAGPPLDIERLLKLATAKDGKGNPLLPRETILKAVRNRKVTFQATDENLERLREAGVDDEVIAVVREMNPPPAPTQEPPKPATGILVMSCAPKECGVQVDGGPLESTKGGLLRKTVTVGKHLVDFTRAGYMSERRPAEVSAGEVRLEQVLRPDAATKRTIGYQLFDRMLQALGDENAEVNARGSWSVQKGGLPEESTFAIRMSGTQTTLALQNVKGVYELACQGETCQAKKATLIKGKDLKGNDAQRADNELKVFRRYNLAYIARELRARRASTLQASAESEQPGPDGNYHVHLEGPNDVYELTLDQRLLPVSITFTSKLASSSVLRMAYTDYTDLGALRYPKVTQISVPDPKVGLIQVRLDTFPPSLK